MPGVVRRDQARSISRGRGSGSASAVTTTSWSALATTTRSTGSSSSAVRRSIVRRSATSTIRASVPSSPEMSPTRPTRSPTTTPLRPSSRAFIAVTGRAVDEQGVAAPVDGDHDAVDGVLVVGRSLVRGRVRRRGPLVVLVVVLGVAAASRGVPHDTSRPDQAPAKSGKVLAWSRCPRPGRRRRRGRGSRRRGPSGGRRRCGTTPPCSGAGRMRSPSVGLGDVGAEAAELGGEGGEPVGLVAADVGDAAQLRRRVGQRAQGGDGRGQLADVVQVDVDARAGVAGAGHGQARRRRGSTVAPIGSSISRSASPAWVVCCGQPAR